MTAQIAFLPHSPNDNAVPTLAEIKAATLVMDGAFIDITAVFKQANEAAAEAGEAARRLYGNYETSLSFTIQYPVTRRENRQVATRWARLFRRPALIHNGRKPR